MPMQYSTSHKIFRADAVSYPSLHFQEIPSRGRKKKEEALPWTSLTGEDSACVPICS